MDLSKAFDCLPHDLLIAKLAAYGLGYRSLRFLWSYLTNRKMRVRVGSALSEWLNILLGVPQGSMLGPILFNIFINDLFLLNLESQICNFADDNTLYSCDISLDALIQKLHKDSASVVKWFRYNEMVVNPDKFQIMFLGCNDLKVSLDIDTFNITSTDTVKLLGITLDNKLNFNSHIEGICKKANQKISALFRIRKYLDREKAKLLSNSFILSHLRYCSLIWMFCSKLSARKIASTQRRAIRAIEIDFDTPSELLLLKYDFETIHITNLRMLLIEVYKSLHRLNPEFMWELFQPKHINVNLRCGKPLTLPKSSVCTTNSLVFRAILAWNNLPSFLKEAPSLAKFKSCITKERVFYCQCKGCI